MPGKPTSKLKKKNQAIKRQWWEIKTSLEPRTLRQGASRDLSKS